MLKIIGALGAPTAGRGGPNLDLRVAYLAGSPGTLPSHLGSGSRVHWDACLAPTHLAHRVGWVPAASWSKASWLNRPTSSRPGSCGNMARAASTMAVLHVIFTIATYGSDDLWGIKRNRSWSSPLEGHCALAWVTFSAPANVFMPGGTRRTMRRGAGSTAASPSGQRVGIWTRSGQRVSKTVKGGRRERMDKNRRSTATASAPHAN